MSSIPQCLGPSLLIVFALFLNLSILLLTRLAVTLVRPRPRPLGSIGLNLRIPNHTTHLLIVLGSGGHTTEMLNILYRVPSLQARFTHRTYIVTSGDGFSAQKARLFERDVSGRNKCAKTDGGQGSCSYDIVTIRRARNVHQRLLLTPLSVLLCTWDCIKVLRGTHRDQNSPEPLSGTQMRRTCPDIILTNGPGTGVCAVSASLILLLFRSNQPFAATRYGSNVIERPEGPQQSGHMRSIFIESWARVKTLSLSGVILLPFVDRFLVQWPGQRGTGWGKVEFMGSLVA